VILFDVRRQDAEMNVLVSLSHHRPIAALAGLLEVSLLHPRGSLRRAKAVRGDNAQPQPNAHRSIRRHT
jgi:hypothetical protein